MTEAQELLDEINEYCQRTGTKPTNFGLSIGAGKGFVNHLREGTQPKPATIARARRFMAGETPVRMARVELDKIRPDLRAQPRDQVSADVVARYVEDMAAGADFPPLVAFQEGEVYWLADGFHRYQAALATGLAHFPCEVREGGIRDAVLYACGANAAHGLQRSNADKRRAVTRLLQDDEWRQWSDREIARRCRVSHDFVNRLRAELYPPILSSDDSMDRTRTFIHPKTGKPSAMATGRINRDRAESAAPLSSDDSERALTANVGREPPAVAPASESKLDLVLTLLDGLTDEELGEVRIAIDLLEETREDAA